MKPGYLSLLIGLFSCGQAEESRILNTEAASRTGSSHLDLSYEVGPEKGSFKLHDIKSTGQNITMNTPGMPVSQFEIFSARVAELNGAQRIPHKALVYRDLKISGRTVVAVWNDNYSGKRLEIRDANLLVELDGEKVITFKKSLNGATKFGQAKLALGSSTLSEIPPSLTKNIEGLKVSAPSLEVKTQTEANRIPLHVKSPKPAEHRMSRQRAQPRLR